MATCNLGKTAVMEIDPYRKKGQMRLVHESRIEMQSSSIKITSCLETSMIKSSSDVNNDSCKSPHIGRMKDSSETPYKETRRKNKR